MAKKENSESSNPLGCLAPAVGIAGLVATLLLGPIDLGRSVYNQIIGDTPVLKIELLDYARRAIQRSNPEYTTRQVESSLASELGYKLEGDKIPPQEVSIENLWAASEIHARSWYQKWFWISLKE